METREGWDIHEVLRLILAFIAGIIACLSIEKLFGKKRGGKKRRGKT